MPSLMRSTLWSHNLKRHRQYPVPKRSTERQTASTAYPYGIDSKEGEPCIELRQFRHVTVCAVWLKSGPAILRAVTYGRDAGLACAMGQFKDIKVCAVFEFVYRYFCKLLRDTGSALVSCAIRQFNDMTVVTFCHSVAENVVNVWIKSGAGT